MGRETLNYWAAQSYFNPTKVLEEAGRAGYRHVAGGRNTLPIDIPRSDRKQLIEGLDAAVFAHGLRKLMPDRDICIAELEARDHDFILRFGPSKDPMYCPLQLKVLVSEDVNRSQTIEELLDSLRRYADSADLVVAIKIDRLGIDVRRVRVPRLTIGELWYFGQAERSVNTWFLYGDCVGAPFWFDFELPGDWWRAV